jgi:hypothetical protein
VSDVFVLNALAGQSHAEALAVASAQPVTPEHVAGVTETPAMAHDAGHSTHCASPSTPIIPYVVGTHATHAVPFQRCPSRQHEAVPASAPAPPPPSASTSQLVAA